MDNAVEIKAEITQSMIEDGDTMIASKALRLAGLDDPIVDGAIVFYGPEGGRKKFRLPDGHPLVVACILE